MERHGAERGSGRRGRVERYSALGVTGSGVGGFTGGFTGRFTGGFTVRFTGSGSRSFAGSVVEGVCGDEVEGGGAPEGVEGCVLG